MIHYYGMFHKGGIRKSKVIYECLFFFRTVLKKFWGCLRLSVFLDLSGEVSVLFQSISAQLSPLEMTLIGSPSSVSPPPRTTTPFWDFSTMVGQCKERKFFLVPFVLFMYYYTYTLIIHALLLHLCKMYKRFGLVRNKFFLLTNALFFFICLSKYIDIVKYYYYLK